MEVYGIDKVLNTELNSVIYNNRLFYSILCDSFKLIIIPFEGTYPVLPHFDKTDRNGF